MRKRHTFTVVDLHLFMLVPVGSLRLDQNGTFHRHSAEVTR